MSVFYRCDICRTETRDSNDFRKIVLPHMNRHMNQYTDEREGYHNDICVSCSREIKEFIKSLEIKK
jgi:DNA-directed RNA polymerase subunit RPC12/RpoP